ncbi:hypothetical protein PAXRUDRAFT_827271 [Paxillus rubicundulus Ve08.2h10]|uniref:Uncharacterized protein n=1 Tax=Paxillus rubicundulus Ve08.2h10 TaxID=930991 RepID=A0A0D0DD16_9AGAM|nr:hypothetical protein PAXRUDRAFT_827271 [Paxillus rubicundulus Ve08.2h10]
MPRRFQCSVQTEAPSYVLAVAANALCHVHRFTPSDLPLHQTSSNLFFEDTLSLLVAQTGGQSLVP